MPGQTKLEKNTLGLRVWLLSVWFLHINTVIRLQRKVTERGGARFFCNFTAGCIILPDCFCASSICFLRLSNDSFSTASCFSTSEGKKVININWKLHSRPKYKMLMLLMCVWSLPQENMRLIDRYLNTWDETWDQVSKDQEDWRSWTLSISMWNAQTQLNIWIYILYIMSILFLVLYPYSQNYTAASWVTLCQKLHQHV